MSDIDRQAGDLERFRRFQERLIEEFRANGGKVSAFEGARMLLLTTTGARSGRRHTVPLGYLPDGARVLVIGSANGASRHPDWYHNILADPRVTVEDGIFTYEAEAKVLQGTERDELFARAVEADPAWGEYQARTDRVIPVVALERTGDAPPDASSWGEALKKVHEAFRRELILVRREVAESGAGLGAQLRVNCLSVCQGLHFHHQGEDTVMFPPIRERFPELAPVVDRLEEEHKRIAALLDELEKVLAAERPDTASVRREVDLLTTELESHLAYEEEQLIPYMDAAVG